jgi:endonuclease/exonuclease/phosphatase (EEP) superfamily protein YafD
MVSTVKGTVHISIMIAYAPTAPDTEQHNDSFCKRLNTEVRTVVARGLVLIAGDFNSSIQSRLTEEKKKKKKKEFVNILFITPLTD